MVRTNQQLKRWATNLGLTVATIVIALLVVEGLMRASRSGQVGFFRADPELGYAQRAGWRGHHRFGEVVEINSHGSRDLERTIERPANITRRILVLGDSHAWGTGVDRTETVAARLEATLDRTEVLNAAVPGYDTFQQSIYLRSRGTAFEPDVVLLLFCDNDLDGVETVGPLRSLYNPSEVPPVPFLREHSYAYGFLKYHIDVLRSERGIGQGAAPEDLPDAWRVFERHLRDIHEATSQIGAELVVAPIPDRRILEGVRTSDVFERLEALTSTIGAAYVDTVSPFEAAHEAGAVLFLEGDHHIDANGHALIARTVAARL